MNHLKQVSAGLSTTSFTVHLNLNQHEKLFSSHNHRMPRIGLQSMCMCVSVGVLRNFHLSPLKFTFLLFIEKSNNEIEFKTHEHPLYDLVTVYAQTE